MSGTNKITLPPTEVTEAADELDGLIDPFGVNAHRAVPRIFGRGVCEVGFDAG